MKECFKCGAEKPLTDFYKHSRMKDGHLNKCKECTKRDVRDRRFDPKTREAVLAYDRARGNRQPPEYFVAYREKYPEKLKARLKANRERWPEKYKARNAVSNAVRDGRLHKPDHCESCGTSDFRQLEGHHDDYSKPLDVRWLCAPCHRQWHAANDMEATWVA